MAQTAEQYFKQLFAEAGIDDATAGTVLTHFNNPKVAEKVNGVLKIAQDDYNAQLGRVSAAEKRVKQYDDWYGTASTQHNAALAELAELKRQQNGGYQDPPQFDASKYISKEDLQQFALDQGRRYSAVIKDATRIASDHVARFGEAPDMDAIEKIAADNNLPLKAAYDQYVRPRVEEKQTKDMEARIKAARDEGARDALSRHSLPVDAAPSESAPINRYGKPGSGGDTKPATDAELLATWNSAGKAQ